MCISVSSHTSSIYIVDVVDLVGHDAAESLKIGIAVKKPP